MDQTDRFNQLRKITSSIRDDEIKTPDVTRDEQLLNEILAFIGECTLTELQDMLPQSWIQWIEHKFVNPMWNPEFWRCVASKECYMYTKASRRFFPMVGDENWKKLSKECYKSNYPDFESHDKTNHDNYKAGNNLKLHTNFGMVPQLSVDRIEVETMITLKVISVALKLTSLQDKLWYTLATNYDLCHILLKQSLGRTLTRHVWSRDRDLVQAGLFWTMYILAHEEQTCIDATEQSRFVITLEELGHLSFLNNLPLDTTPWIVNAMRNGNNLYNVCPFYLRGDRSINTPAEAQRRIDLLTQGCFRGFDQWSDVAALTGSTTMQSVVNNPLLRPATKDDGQIHLADDRIHKDIESFKNRSELYFPRDGSMSSDLDIAFSGKNKAFIPVADAMVERISENLGSPCTVDHDCTASGVRYHVRHPKLGLKIEIFRSPKKRMSLVSSFHVAPARMYWNFSKGWYMTRSCAASFITGVSENFHWFSSNKVPADVILKYAQRGVTTVLNHKELECTSKHVESSDRWGYGFHTVGEITGSFSWNHPFFRVDVIPRGIRFKLPALPGHAGNWRENVYKLSRKLKTRGHEFPRYQEGANGDGFRVSTPPRLFEY